MAARSTAGTGVVVSLVVFVLCAVFLLILSIVFYTGQTKAAQSDVDAQAALARFVTREQQNRDQIKALVAKAEHGPSVVQQLQLEYQELMGYVSGNPGNTFAALQSELVRFGVPPQGESVRNVLQTRAQNLRNTQNDLDSLTTKLTDRGNEISELRARAQQVQQDHLEALDAVRSGIAEYGEAAEEYRREVEEVKNDYFGAIDRLRDEFEGQIAGLENEKDTLYQQVASLKGRVDELQAILSKSRLRAENPAMLVDGHIIDAAGSSDQVFIDRGRQHRMVLGMTFEVYDRDSAIRVNPNTGDLPRGKASLQVIRVADTTSTCKITRTVPGRPVVRNDVIANAVYDPNYVFRFLVHGKFDVDGDGRPSEGDAEYLRSLIIDWGGSVVTGEQLPGDLDFLVLGVAPPLPPPLAANASQFQIDDWVRKRRAHEKYQELFTQAREAQIPVLNSNRFFILIGHTER